MESWVEYRERNGIPGALPMRQHMVDGRWRIGWDVPTLFPPGYGRARSETSSRGNNQFEAADRLLEKIRSFVRPEEG